MSEIPLILSIDGSKAKAGSDEVKRGLNELKDAGHGADKSLKSVEGSFDKATEAARRFLSVAAVVGFFTKLAREAAEAEKSQLRLEAVIRSTGNAAGISAEKIDKWASAMENITLFDDEKIKDAAAALLIFNNVQGATFERAIKLAMDLSAEFGGDLTSSALQIGKALENPAANLSALNRQLRAFGPAQIAAITAMQNAGDAAGAQAAILDVLQGKVNGVAEAMATGLPGSLHHAVTAFGDFFEEVGKVSDQQGGLSSVLQGTANVINFLTETAIKAFGKWIPDAILISERYVIRLMEALHLISSETANGAALKIAKEIGDNIRLTNIQLEEFRAKSSGAYVSLADGAKKANIEIEKTPEFIAAAAAAAEKASKAADDQFMRRVKGNLDDIKNNEDVQQQAIDKQAKAYEHLAERIQDTLGDAFYKIATGADDLADSIKDAMIRAAADSAAAWATQQIMPTVAGFISGSSSSGGGSSGSSSGAASAAQSAATSMTGSSLAGAMGMSAGMAFAVGAGMLISIAAINAAIEAYKPRAHPASTFGTEVGQDNVLLNTEYQSKHMGTDYAKGIASLVEGILAGFQAGGTDLSGTTVHGGIDDGHGFLRIADKVVAEFDPADENSLAGALAKFSTELAKSSDVVNLDMVTALQNLSTEGKTLTQVIEEINAALARDMLRKQFNASNVSSYIAGASPEAAALMAEQQSFNAALTTAKELGANLDLVYRVHAQNIAKIQAQYGTLTQGMQDTVNKASALAVQYRDIGESLADAIFGLKTGALSTLSPGDQLALARSQFGTTAAAARMGDADAMRALPGLANTFLGLSKAFYASSTDYARDFESVTGAMEAARATAARQVGIQEQIAKNTAAQIAATTTGFASLAAIMANIASAEKVSAGTFTGKSYSGSNANEIVVKNKAAIQAAGLMGVVNSLLDTYSYGTTPGDKRRSEFFAGNSGQNSAFIAAAKAAGIPGFAMGGQHPVGMPYMVGERGPEIRVDRSAGTIIPIQNNDAILREMQQSNRHLSATVVVLKAGMSELIEENKANAKAIRALAEAQSRTRVEKAGRK